MVRSPVINPVIQLLFEFILHVLLQDVIEIGKFPHPSHKKVVIAASDHIHVYVDDGFVQGIDGVVCVVP